ncbi:hypothetical protein [Patulibacter minatonensis]|uniref:hypothetical protein n=1 Tax=Patulibacter minatonensis TaxID=298163 RepID=UPI00047ECFDD|nr:hypothetical protein [Patulibacter minatonensis]
MTLRRSSLRTGRLLAASGLALLSTAALAAPAGATTWGIADQKPQTFTNSSFLELRDAGMTSARYVMRFDALKYKNDASRKFYAEQADTWLKAAQAANVRPLVTFWVTASNSSSLKRTISTSAYMTEFKRFRKAYPFVKDFSIFNEPNLTGAFKTKPEALGRIYKEVVKNCSGCRVLGGDLHLTSGSEAGNYAARVRKGAGSAVKLWGLNNYNDVNDGRSTDTARFLRSSAVKGSKVWITESGGVYARKASSEKSNPFLAQKKKATSDAARSKYQLSGTKYLKTIASKYKSQIQRVYVYQLQSEPNASWTPGSRNGSWDSGLLDPRGQKRATFDYVLGSIL